MNLLHLCEAKLRIIQKITRMEGECLSFLLVDIEAPLDRRMESDREFRVLKSFKEIDAMIFGPDAPSAVEQIRQEFASLGDMLIYRRSVVRGEIKNTREDCGPIECVKTIRNCCGVGLFDAKQYYDRFMGKV